MEKWKFVFYCLELPGCIGGWVDDCDGFVIKLLLLFLQGSSSHN